jgi:hypothetical protein
VALAALLRMAVGVLRLYSGTVEAVGQQQFVVVMAHQAAARDPQRQEPIFLAVTDF